jgi:hypothetical protein
VLPKKKRDHHSPIATNAFEVCQASSYMPHLSHVTYIYLTLATAQ